MANFTQNKKIQNKKIQNKKTKKHRKIQNQEKKIYFIHIPKTAGTTIENILYDTYKNNYSISIKKIKNNKNINEKLKINNIHISPHHIPPVLFKSNILNYITNNYIVFAIVRNPYDRIISDFKFWIEYAKNRQHKIDNLTKKENFLINEITSIYKSFDISSKNLNDFVHTVIPHNSTINNNNDDDDDNNNNNINKNIISVLDGHLIPMYHYVYTYNNKKIKDCEVLKYENLNEHFNNFIKKYKLNIPSNIINNEKYLTNTTKKSTLNKSSLDKKSLQLIQNFYYLDFKYFNYE